MNQKDIDQLFRDAAHAEKAPQYDNAYWEEMNVLLHKKDAKRRKAIYWMLAETSVLVLFLLIVFTAYKPSPEKGQYVQEAERSFPLESSTNSEKTASKKLIEKKEIQYSEKQVEKEQVEEISNEHLRQEEINEKLKNKVASTAIRKNDIASHTLALPQNNSSFVDEKMLANKEEDVVKEEDIVKTYSLSPFYVVKLQENSIQRLRYSEQEYKPRPSYALYAKTSIGVMENYKTSRPFESGLFDFSLNFESNLNNVLIRVGLGTQYTSNADLIVSQRKKVYDYKIIEVQSDLSYQGLLDIYIPLELGYQFRSTSFGIGIQANYLLSTTMNLSIYEDLELKSTERFTGKKNGLNAFSTQSYLWLEQSLTPRIALGLKVGTNISGRLVKNSDYFNNSSTTNPIYGQLSLRFNILK
ncbi:MAG TPA: hypothetical protein VKX31_00930 [Brumimicrobium sp.]|nr:hypothetical protein [Brumimicrobium sp.]